MTRRYLILLGLLAVSISTVAHGLQQPQQEDEASAAVDPTAIALVKRVAEHISDSENFRARLVHAFRVSGIDASGEMAQEATYELLFQQPNLLRYEAADQQGETIVSDGEQMYIHFPNLNRYVQREAPDDLNGLIRKSDVGTIAGSGPGGFGGPLPIAGMFFVSDFPNMDDGHIRRATRMGTEEIDGVTAERISLVISMAEENEDPASLTPSPTPSGSSRFRTDPLSPQDAPQPRTGNGVTPPRPDLPDVILDAWIEEREDAAILRRVELDLASMFAAMTPGDEGPQFSMEMWVSLSDWEFDTEISEDRFTFTPPEGAQRVDSVMEAILGAAAQQRPAHALVGQQAPNFELQRLMGSQIELAQHRGSDIVILDFWATWCTPCVRALPQLMSVAEEFRDQNVVLYAVNIGEEFEKVQSFIEERGWHDLMVPMDTNRQVANLYEVRAIPQTVIIDRDGMIQAVHVGFSPAMGEQLRTELQTLIDGGSLLDDAEPEQDQE